MPRKSKKLEQKIVERGSVKFHAIGDTDFYLTTVNRVFLVTKQGRIIFPRLSGGYVKFDETDYEPTPEISKWLLGVLVKQKEIRYGWTTKEEDDAAFTYS